MKVIGVVGGVCSGKSLVSRRLSDFGAVVLDADQTGHAVLCEAEIIALVRDRWGEDVFDASGRVDRSQVARRVFGPPPDGPRELAFLEQVTHPRIGVRLRQRMDRIATGQPDAMVVLDAALLIEAGWDVWCGQLIFVDAPRAVRLARAERRGWTEADFDAREAAQAPLDKKRSRADVVIDNSTSPEHTWEQLEPWRRCLSDASCEESSKS